jgi:sucrose synthase
LQEAVVNPPYVVLSIRPSPGFWEFVKVNSADLSVEGITATDYLKFKEMIYDENWYAIVYTLLFSLQYLTEFFY